MRGCILDPAPCWMCQLVPNLESESERSCLPWVIKNVLGPYHTLLSMKALVGVFNKKKKKVHSLSTVNIDIH